MGADSQCCSQNCDHLVIQNGVMYGHCYPPHLGEKTVVNKDASSACKPEGKTCSGKYIYDADAECCSGSCGSLVFLNGKYHGTCDGVSCQPLRATCQGSSFDEADSQCCSQNCDHLVIKNGVMYGHCYPPHLGEKTVVNKDSSSSCRPKGKTCSGKYINDADAECCSGSC